MEISLKTVAKIKRDLRERALAGDKECQESLSLIELIPFDVSDTDVSDTEK